MPGGNGPDRAGLVRFWDTSAVVPLLLEQEATASMEALPSEEVRERAARLLRVHSLKAADALPLAAALV
jgi:predicted nucleic acid-binding protein